MILDEKVSTEGKEVDFAIFFNPPTGMLASGYNNAFGFIYF